MAFLYAGFGLLILLLAGDALVRGAVNMSLRLGMPALIVCLTVVAFGTSAPELLISVEAVLDGVPGHRAGQRRGLEHRQHPAGARRAGAHLGTAHQRARHQAQIFWLMLGASCLFIALAFTGPLTWVHGLILLAALAAMLGGPVRRGARAPAGQWAADARACEGADPKCAGGRSWPFLALGLVGLPLGADILVDAAREHRHATTASARP